MPRTHALAGVAGAARGRNRLSQMSGTRGRDTLSASRAGRPPSPRAFPNINFVKPAAEIAMMEEMAGMDARHDVTQPNGLERLLCLADDVGDEAGLRVRVLGALDERPTWLVNGDWRLFARPARELVTGGEELARFELPDGSSVSASADAARTSVFLPSRPRGGIRQLRRRALVPRSAQRRLTPRQLQPL